MKLEITMITIERLTNTYVAPGDVLGEAVVWVVQSAVQVRHAVVGLSRHVAPLGRSEYSSKLGHTFWRKKDISEEYDIMPVSLLCQTTAEREGNLGLEKPGENELGNC